MKNGFTLIELLGILTLLGIIILVTMPAIINSNKIANDNKKDDFKNALNTACETYVNVEQINSTTSVSVQDFISKGYLRGNLINPKTNKKMSDEVGNITITIENGNITCTY